MQVEENGKRQWESAVDLIPQLLCLLDAQGQVMRANRTVERWGLGSVSGVRGLRLHEVLHPGCQDPDCYLAHLWGRSAADLAEGRGAEHETFDPMLKRHVAIHIQQPARARQGEAGGVYAVVTVDDVSDFKAWAAKFKRVTRKLGQRAVLEREERLRTEGAWVRAEEALRGTEAELRRLAAEHLNIQESERKRIAADLHDGLGQSLSLIRLAIDEAARQVGAGANTEALHSLQRLLPRVKDAMGEMRRISMDLRPSTLDDLGILPTLSWFFREFEASCRNIEVLKDFELQERDVPVPLKLAIFRIIQEAINNIVKHAKADQVVVSLRRVGDALQLCIEDDGLGFDPGEPAGRNGLTRGLGLRSMRERAELSGGEYDLRSVPGRGTRIFATWACAGPAQADSAAPAERRVPAASPVPEAKQYFPEALAFGANCP